MNGVMKGLYPQKEFLQQYPYEKVEGYKDLFRDNSVFYCRDIHSLTPAQSRLFESQGICSTLQCALYDDKEFCGFIGFDECTGLRMWNKEEIGILSLVAQMLTTFLSKKRGGRPQQTDPGSAEFNSGYAGCLYLCDSAGYLRAAVYESKTSQAGSVRQARHVLSSGIFRTQRPL